MWGKVSYLRKQHDGRDWASNHRTSDLKSNTLTTTPQRPNLLILLWNLFNSTDAEGTGTIVHVMEVSLLQR